jgi:putative SOS response-associated peptidase YedK
VCGRFTRTRFTHQVAALFDALADAADRPPSYNIAPTQPVAAIRQEDDGRHLRMLRWGLIPEWADDRSIGARMINARAETVAEKPAFRAAFRKRRCLIVADGFFEWKTEGKHKWPHYFRLKAGEPFAFAGLWEHWSKGEQPVETCTILTTEANSLLRPVHERMPVILRPDDYGRWLHPKETAAKLLPMLVPFSADLMESRAVSKLVNSPKNNVPECIQPAV